MHPARFNADYKRKFKEGDCVCVCVGGGGGVGERVVKSFEMF